MGVTQHIYKWRTGERYYFSLQQPNDKTDSEKRDMYAHRQSRNRRYKKEIEAAKAKGRKVVEHKDEKPPRYIKKKNKLK